MKKSISMLLALIMALSVFSAAIVPVGAAFIADSLVAVTPSEYVNDTITYTVSLNGGVQKLTGAIFKAVFDPNVLKLVSATAAGGNDTPNVPGMYETDYVLNSNSEYSLAFINASGSNIGSETGLFTITFEAISPLRPTATVDFTCVEFITDDGLDNDLKRSAGDLPQTILSHSFNTLGTPSISAVVSYETGLKVEWNEVVGADYYNVYRDNEEPIKVTDAEYVDLTIAQGTEYSYSVSAVNGYGETAKSAVTKGLNFGSVSGVNAVKNANGNGILVSWNSLSGADNYTVERALVNGSSWSKVANVTGTQYDDTTAASGVEYKYRVRAHKGVYIADMVGAYPTAIYLAKPTLSLANVSNGLQLSISAVGGAQQYIIKKSVNDGAFEDFKTVDASGLRFVDTAVTDNGKYAYTVQAVAGSLYSDVAIRVVLTRLATPVLSAVSNANGGVYLTWNSVSGASSYSVYRKTETGNYAVIGNTTGLSYTDASAVNGTVYTYTVVAENNTGCSGYNVSGLTIKRVGTTSAVYAKTKANGIYVSWDVVSGANSYIVYRKTSSNAFVQIGTSIGTSYEDKTATLNTQYVYSVAAVNSGYTGAINTTGAQGMNFGTVSTINYSPIKNGITVSWGKVNNAEGYRVYRKTESDSSYSKIATVTSGTSFNDTQMSSGVVYYYVIEAYKGSNVADMSVNALSAKYLSTPVFTARNSGDDVKITITAVRGADTYIIERADGNSTAFSQIATLTDGKVEYLDTKNIVAGQKYTYRVRAISGSVKSFDSVVSMTKMIAPRLTSCYNEVAGVQLRWTAVDGATQYTVYRRTPGGQWGYLATTGRDKTEFLDASVVGNTVYQYTVEAKTADGLTGYDSVGRECRFIETPDLISRTNAVGGVTIKWNKVAGATSYRIYRRGAGVNYWYYLGDFPATLDTFTDLETANYFPNDPAKNSLAKPKSGNYYRYTVRASYDGKDSSGNDYLIYSGFDTNGLYLKYVATPKLLSVSNASNGITVKWNKVNGGGSTWYRVYRRGAGSTYWYYLGATQNTSFTDTKIAAANNQYYRYTVRAVAGTADKGWYSAFDTTGLFLKRLINPVLVSAASANGGITVKWKPVAGTTGYYVYRKTANSTWVRVGTVGGANNVTFIDKTAQKGVTYTYTVRACYGYTLSSYNTKGVSARR